MTKQDKALATAAVSVIFIGAVALYLKAKKYKKELEECKKS